MKVSPEAMLGIGVVAAGVILWFANAAAPIADNKPLYVEQPPAAMPEKERSQLVAQSCWKEYERKSLTPNEKIGIAKICEGLDAKAASYK